MSPTTITRAAQISTATSVAAIVLAVISITTATGGVRLAVIALLLASLAAALSGVCGAARRQLDRNGDV